MSRSHETVGRVGLDPNGLTTTTLRRREGRGERRHPRDHDRPPDDGDSVTIGAESDAPAPDQAPVVAPQPAHAPGPLLPDWDKARRF